MGVSGLVRFERLAMSSLVFCKALSSFFFRSRDRGMTGRSRCFPENPSTREGGCEASTIVSILIKLTSMSSDHRDRGEIIADVTHWRDILFAEVVYAGRVRSQIGGKFCGGARA